MSTWADLTRNTGWVFNASPRQSYFTSYQMQLRDARQQQQAVAITAEQWRAFVDLLTNSNPLYDAMHRRWPKVLDLPPGV